ncbi:nuclear transport factor 2 family protein [Actinomadura sp. HBU206391]|uniref:nuclear transport factor 2 family protein n=1 Tax=Actinomadura sp. HBU206391 TaxID=2731692 RepID=UPI0016503250|nr:nuclear transport factor 2 family protein [Actinomadura sp. HBU206391]MBC6458817.1 nuclear transport factor 2 family protein [Actinomadura sp. HBU206391]
MMIRAGRMAVVVSVALALAACSSDDGPGHAASAPPASVAPSPRTSGGGSTAPAGADRAEAERVVRRFTDALNAGDEDGARESLAEDARFDSVGRIYPSRDDIMNDFLIPEVLQANGGYRVVGERWNGGRYIVDYEFTTGGGGRERFYYDYLIRDGLIRDVVGRYS